MPAQAFAPSAMPPTAPATPAGTRTAVWRGDRLGLTIIVASLAVIALILAYLFHDRQQARVEQIRGQGIVCCSCLEYSDSGHKGQHGTHDVLNTDEGLQRLVMANTSRDQLKANMRQRSVGTLFGDGLLHAHESMAISGEVNGVVNL
jgi:hypothetical protein